MASIREVTRRQFQTGTVVAGSQMDDAFADVVEAANAIAPRHLARRETFQMASLGWMPSPKNAAQPQFPWLPQRNTTGAADLLGNPSDLGIQNANRAKGCADSGCLVWSTAYAFDRPVVLDQVEVFLLTGSPFVADLANVSDLTIVAAIDDPFMPENLAASAVVFQAAGFSTAAFPFSGQTIPGGWTNMNPPHPLGAPVGVAFTRRHLNVPMPKGRFRFCICIPNPADPSDSPWTGDDEGKSSWQTFSPSVTLGWREAA